jgi:hypothetical protein
MVLGVRVSANEGWEPQPGTKSVAALRQYGDREAQPEGAGG